MIIISSVINNDEIKTAINFDKHVPFSLTTWNKLLGAKYLRLGDFEDNLLEIMLDPISFVMRGLTLVCFNKIHQPKNLSVFSEEVGLPVLDLTKSGLEKLHEASRADVRCQFTIGMGPNFVELDLFGIAYSDAVVRRDRVEFYSRNKALVGVRIISLKIDELSVFESHAQLISGEKI